MKNLYVIYKTNGKDFRYSFGQVEDDYKGEGLKGLCDWLVANNAIVTKNGDVIQSVKKAYCKNEIIEDIHLQ